MSEPNAALARLRSCTGCGMPSTDCVTLAMTGQARVCCTLCDHPYPPVDLPRQAEPDDGLW